MYGYAPVAGNEWAEGDITGPVFADSLGAMLYMAMGSCSSSQTADAANPLGSDADISDAGGVITVSNPTSSAFLKIAISSAAGSGLSIALSGTDANGTTVSETLPITLDTGSSTVYSRYSYTGSITCVATGFSSGAVQVDGYTKSAHTFTQADTVVSYSGINLGDAERGSGEAATYAGGICTGLSFEFDADAPAAGITYKLNWLSKYGTFDTAPTLYQTVDKPFPALGASFTKDGSAYYHIQSFSMDVATGNALAFVADGGAGPRYTIPGKFGSSGKMTLLVEDETEWGYYKDGTELDFHMTWANAGDLLYTGQNKNIVWEFTRTYFTAATAKEVKGAQAIDVDFITIRDDSDKSLKATLTNAVYSY